MSLSMRPQVRTGGPYRPTVGATRPHGPGLPTSRSRSASGSTLAIEAQHVDLKKFGRHELSFRGSCLNAIKCTASRLIGAVSLDVEHDLKVAFLSDAYLLELDQRRHLGGDQTGHVRFSREPDNGFPLHGNVTSDEPITALASHTPRPERVARFAGRLPDPNGVRRRFSPIALEQPDLPRNWRVPIRRTPEPAVTPSRAKRKRRFWPG